MLPLQRRGGAGCITATSNVIARQSCPMSSSTLATVTTNPALKAAQARIVKARELVSQFPQMASLKALAADRTKHAVGSACGRRWSLCRRTS
jgi:4-hydroxy-tetrahydrodipicolinate synthase